MRLSASRCLITLAIVLLVGCQSAPEHDSQTVLFQQYLSNNQLSLADQQLAEAGTQGVSADKLAPYERQLADAYLRDSARYIAHYSERIGAYPFTEFSVVASPLPTGFGMPTLTYLGEQVLCLPFIRASSLGHEVLHNWWGNGVQVDYASGNWSEGLTTFMADYAYKEEQSAAAAREMRLGWLRDFAALPADAHQALAEFRSRTHGAAAAVGYGKAAMVFVMLRDLIGEEAFAHGIRSFWAQNRFRIAGWTGARVNAYMYIDDLLAYKDDVVTLIDPLAATGGNEHA